MRILDLHTVRDWLWPVAAEADEGFRQEVLSLSHRGIGIIAFVELGLGVVALAGFLMHWQSSLALLVIGAATMWASRPAWLYERNRTIAAASSGLAATISAWEITYGPSHDYAVGAASAVLITSAIMPLLPAQSLAIGGAAIAAGVTGIHGGFLVLVALASVAVTGTLYAQRRENYGAYMGVLQASQALRSRLLISESSATMVRMSAALAHELSSPIGSASSAINTLLMVSARITGASPQEQERMLALQGDLARSLNESMARLKLIVNRIQRLTVLDEATTQRANLNELVKEALDIVSAETNGHVSFDLRLGDVPEITCRPQQIVWVFCSLITNSFQAMNGGGTVTISTRQLGERLEAAIADNGRGIPPERLAHIFDPAFQTAEGRISTGNWSLFTSRQFIKDHGGEMRIQSQPGSGTTVTFTLPC